MKEDDVSDVNIVDYSKCVCKCFCVCVWNKPEIEGINGAKSSSERINSSRGDQTVSRRGGDCTVPVVVSVAERSYWDSERLPHWI